MITCQDALTRATSQLSAHPDLRATALADAVVLLLHTLAIARPALIAHPERPLDRDQQASYQRLLERRLRFEPIQYIVGTVDFYGLTLRVSPAVLIPRPETEILVEYVTELVRRSPHSLPIRIVDVGTGSGAIALALASSLNNVYVTAIDLSSDALAVARENTHTLGLKERVRLLQSDLLAAIADDPPPDSPFDPRFAPPFDIIVSNPPYIQDSDSTLLHPQVRDHEPPSALFAGPTGLEIYRRLIPQARALLKPQGLLALEIGHGQRNDLAALLADWSDINFLPDLQGIPRVALARRP